MMQQQATSYKLQATSYKLQDFGRSGHKLSLHNKPVSLESAHPPASGSRKPQ